MLHHMATSWLINHHHHQIIIITSDQPNHPLPHCSMAWCTSQWVTSCEMRSRIAPLPASGPRSVLPLASRPPLLPPPRTPVARPPQDFMDRGALVPDDVVVDMVKSRLAQPDVQSNGWLLDGYPRSGSQAEAIEAVGIRPDSFLLVEVRNML